MLLSTRPTLLGSTTLELIACYPDGEMSAGALMRGLINHNALLPNTTGGDFFRHMHAMIECGLVTVELRGNPAAAHYRRKPSMAPV